MIKNNLSSQKDSIYLKLFISILSILFLIIFVILPIYVIFDSALEKGFSYYKNAIFEEDAIAAVKLTLTVILFAIPLNIIFGICASWAIAKYNFTGKKFLITLIDIPFAVSPVISGLLYAILFSSEYFIGRFFSDYLEIQILFAVPSIILVTIFVTFPFIAKELIPLMIQNGNSEEEAATMFGSHGLKTFMLITFPNIFWGIIYSVLLCNARAMGEFGAVSVISGHIRGMTNSVPLHVEILYNEYNFVAAFAVASILTIFALITLFLREITSIIKLKYNNYSK